MSVRVCGLGVLRESWSTVLSAPLAFVKTCDVCEVKCYSSSLRATCI